MKQAIIILLSTLAILLGVNSAANAQIIDQVTFTEVEPSVLSSEVIETRDFTVVNSGEVGAILFQGTIKALEPVTFASDHQFSLSGPGVNVQGVQFTVATGFDGEIDFIGFVETTGQITTGDILTFSFFDTFNNANSSGANAKIDVTFEFVDRALSGLTKTNLGDFILDQGFYDRGFGGGSSDHPYRAVEFEVSGDGLYSIESIWDDGVGNVNSFDGFIYIFNGLFDGVDDTSNIAFNDDKGIDVDVSKIGSIFLRGGVKYTALLTSFDGESGNDSLRGQLNIVSFEGNTAFLTEVESEFDPALLLPVLLYLLEED